MPWAARLLAALLCLVVLSPALAHRLHVAVQADAAGLRGQAYYADGTPAARERVSLLGAGAAVLASTTTDAHGRFELALASAGSYRVVVSADEGHRAEAQIDWTPLLPVTAAPPTEATAAAADAAALAAAVRAEVAPLREDLARLEARVRLADVVGGVGILVGAFGVWAWWRSRVRH
jgi:nickel transport protein